jgi:hypothetical protein
VDTDLPVGRVRGGVTRAPLERSKGVNAHLMRPETQQRLQEAKECLILSRARSYRGWQKQPSRFLAEMGLTEQSNRT